MLEPEALIGQLRALKALRPQTTTEEATGADALCVGCPPNLRPGAKVTDPVTGQEGEVIGYGQTSLPGEVSEAANG